LFFLKLVTNMRVFLLLISIYGVYAAGGDAIKLRDVESIVLRRGEMTTWRRTMTVPQLKCIKGNGCFKELDIMHCANIGHDGQDVTWKCDAKMGKKFRLGRVNVICEGYNYPEDEYVLKGSCGVEYELFYDMFDKIEPSNEVQSSFSWTFLFLVIFIACLIYIVMSDRPNSKPVVSVAQPITPIVLHTRTSTGFNTLNQRNPIISDCDADSGYMARQSMPTDNQTKTVSNHATTRSEYVPTDNQTKTESSYATTRRRSEYMPTNNQTKTVSTHATRSEYVPTDNQTKTESSYATTIRRTETILTENQTKTNAKKTIETNIKQNEMETANSINDPDQTTGSSYGTTTRR